MKRIILAVTAAAALICAGRAGATDTRTLSQFLLICARTPDACNVNLKDYLRAAKDQGFICLPEDLSLEEAASQELSWLRKEGDSNDAFNQGTAEDAQWTAINALWPCKKDDVKAAE